MQGTFLMDYYLTKHLLTQLHLSVSSAVKQESVQTDYSNVTQAVTNQVPVAVTPTISEPNFIIIPETVSTVATSIGESFSQIPTTASTTFSEISVAASEG